MSVSLRKMGADTGDPFRREHRMNLELDPIWCVFKTSTWRLLSGNRV